MEYLGHENHVGKVVINYMEFTDFVNDFRSDRRDSSDARGVDRIILRLGKEVAKRITTADRLTCTSLSTEQIDEIKVLLMSAHSSVAWKI